jgi:hypothetical protein
LSDSSFNVSILTREESTSTFPKGIKILKADYSSVSSLTTALKGQDAVISAIPSMDVQYLLIDASIAAGVKRFIPSEFGSNTANPELVKVVPIFGGKANVAEYLKKKENVISWTNVITGPFFDWGLKVGFLGFDAGSKTVTIIDNGTAIFSATNLSQIGCAVVRILEKPDLTKNKYVFVSSFETSQNDILATIEKITGEKWTVKNANSKDMRKEGLEKLGKGDMSGVVALIQAGISGAEGFGDNRPEGSWNEKLGLEQEDFEKSIKGALNGKFYGEE